MKITFQTKQAEQEKLEIRQAQTGRHDKVQSSGQTRCAEASFFTKSDKIWENKKGGFREKGKSLIELQQDAQVQDASVQQDYMTLMSHTMSEKDYAKMEEEGFHFKNLDPETAVTIVDKIKAELVRSGENIVGYTDDLDMETLAAAVGSDSLARAIADSFAEADIPLTPENIEGVKKAWDMAAELTLMEDGAESYLLDNSLEPEIWNLYLAENSGAKGGAVSNARYYAEDIQGYFAESAEELTQDVLQEQVERVIVKAGLPVDEESLELGSWLLEKKLPLTAENLQSLHTLRQVKLPVTEEDFARAAANAIAEGKAPIYGKLAKGENLYQRAARLAARRQLEEVRLYMTAEVNVKLLKSGFSIDTAPMEELIAAYKEAEQQLAGQYFPEDTKAVSKYENYCETNRILEELPQLPADILGKWSVEEQGDLSAFCEEGRSLKKAYERAESSYEALGTAPRRDLGDSIRKAFDNVDAILEELQLETTEENRRAVRILGYNQMQLTRDNIELVKEADERVQFVIEKMTPASVLKMIRDDVNPLEKTLTELEEYFKALPEEYQESAESYSRFLYGLERKSAITEEERESYIGVYRLLRQIEKSDGAAVGALLNTQAELHLKNLLSAVRSGRFKWLDVRVTDTLGRAAERVQHGESISEQISKAFVRAAKTLLTDVSYDREAQASYREQELLALRQSAFSDAECVALLQRGQLPANADYLLAAQALLGDASVFYEKMKKKQETPLWEKLDADQDFAEEYGRLAEENLKEAENLTEEANASVDVRNLQLLHKQLRIAGKLAQSEEYFIPMDVDGELTRIHLVVENGAEEQGKVSVDVKLPGGEQIEAQIIVREHNLTAQIAGNEAAEVTKLKEIADIFTGEASKNWTVEEITVQNGAFQKNKAAFTEKKEQTENTELYRAAKVFLGAVKRQREVKNEN